MPGHRVNRTFTLINFLLSRAALAIFHEINTSQRFSFPTCWYCWNLKKSAKKGTQSVINSVYLRVPHGRCKGTCQVMYQENSFGLAAEAYWRLTRQCWSLLSNCSEYRPNNSTNIQRYCTVICTVENLFTVQVGARTQNCHTPPLSLINLLTTAVG